MTDQQRAFGSPPSQPSGLRRLAPWMATAATGGLVVTLAMYGSQLTLPEWLRPSIVAGRAAGDTVRGEIDASKEAKIDLERRMADATEQARVKAAADLAAINKVLEERTAALQTQSTLAGLADVLCMGSMGVAALGSQNTGADWHNGATALAQSSCNVGNQLRANVAQSQLDAVRMASAARGMSMNDGTRPLSAGTATPAPAAPPVDVAAARPVEAPATLGRWTVIQQGQLRAYSYRLPGAVLAQFVAGLDVSHGYPAAWYDRVAAYEAAHRG